MNNLKVRVETFAALFVTLLLALAIGVTPANAIGTFTPDSTVKVGSTTVGSMTDGRLAYSANDGASWNEVSSPLTKNGVSSVSYANGYFIASSFFAGAYSADGTSWTRYGMPVGEKFNPGNIISDAEFFNGNAMTTEEIQRFMETQNTYCVSGYTCLPSFRETTWSRAATAMCDAYQGATNESSATIISKVSRACGVSAEVLLVLLQKEQSLLTSSSPSQGKYNTATGYACPDTSVCDSEYFGFYNQVYNAAKQYKRYSNPVGTSNYFTWYPVGRTTNVRWSPNADCGASPVYIQNQATAGLYYYTPYQPNDASLLAYNGYGDDCSAYGNRNFWRLYNIWFSKDTNFKTFTDGHNGSFVALDADGSIALGSSLTNLTLTGFMSPASKLTGLSWNDTISKYVATTTNSNLVYVSTNGSSWSSSTPPVVPAAIVPTPVTPPVNNTTPTVAPTPTASPSAAPVAPVTTPTESPVAPAPQPAAPTQEPVTPSEPVAKTPVEPTTPVVPTNTSTPTPSVSPSPTASPTATPAPVVTPEVPKSSSAEPATQTVYTVVRGDTVWALSVRYGVKVSNIVEWNQLSNGGNLIYVGQKLVVKQGGASAVPASKPLPVKYYRIQKGDTVASIAKKTNSTVAKITSLNSAASVANLKTGSQLRTQ